MQSGDTDLVLMVVKKLKDENSDSSFFRQVNQYPLARDLYLNRSCSFSDKESFFTQQDLRGELASLLVHEGTACPPPC